MKRLAPGKLATEAKASHRDTETPRNDRFLRVSVPLWPVAVVCAATLAALSPVLHNGFVNFDDPDVLLRNDRLLAPDVIAWSFKTRETGHFQPLAWLTWSAIRRVFDLEPHAYHALSLIVHLLNSILVYLLGLRLAAVATGDRPELAEGRHRKAQVGPWMTGMVASGFFALHPLRVEAVAWASAFPYLLAAAWLLCSALLYIYSARPAAEDDSRQFRLFLWLSILAYAVSLLARPIGVTFPVILLLLDFYPLRRFAAPGRSVASILIEKIPFLVLSLGAIVLEGRARELSSLEEIGAVARLTLAVSTPFLYLLRTAWPVGLTPLDPLALEPQGSWPAILSGVAGLALVTAGAVRAARSQQAHEGILTSWLAYLLLVAPIAGLTPSGLQATADRYMYLPGIAISLAIGGLGGWVLSGRRRLASTPPRTIRAAGAWTAVAAAVAVTLAVATWRQAGWWKDSITLWERAVDLEPRNDVALYNLAVALAEAGREEEAAARYRQTLALLPNHAPARRNLSLLEARSLERQADRLADAGRYREAIDHYSRALALDPARAGSRARRGMALLQTGNSKSAADDLLAARASAREIAADPGIANGLALALIDLDRGAEARQVLRDALALHPDETNLAHNLARLLADDPDRSARDADEAVRLALRVSEATGRRDPRALDTLAAAYAAVGRYDLARDTATRAIELALAAGDSDVAEVIRMRARRYARGPH